MKESRTIKLVLLAALFTFGCGANSEVDDLFGNPPTFVEVPTPTGVSMSITTPAADGKRAGWSATLSGDCNPAGAIITLSGGGVGSAVCQNDLSWSADVDFSGSPVGMITVSAVAAIATKESSSTHTRTFNKIHTSCDSAAARAATFAGGTGGVGNPWLICTSAQLNNVRTRINDEHMLMNDINMADQSMPPINGWFAGTFDGNSFEILNYSYFGPTISYVALFNLLNTTGVVKNVILRDVSMTGGNYAGALVGRSRGVVQDSSTTGVVSGISRVGGVVGWVEASGSVSNCNSSATVTGSADAIGGVVGYTDGAVSGSVGSGNVTGRQQVGGLVGYSNSTVSNSSATGKVVAAGDGVANRSYAGGLVGRSSGISNSYATGTVDVSNNLFAFTYVGGLAGYINGNLSDSYATGTITVNDVNYAQYVGGLVGYVIGTTTGATTVYNGTINVTSTTGNSDYFGGLFGRSNAAITDAGSTGFTMNLVAPATRRFANVGGLTGRHNAGAITNSSVTGTINIENHASATNFGGLVGNNVGTISNCTTNVAFNMTNDTGYQSNVGGVAGASSGTINLCNSSGDIVYVNAANSTNGSNGIGGLVGYATADITNSNVTATTVSVTNSAGRTDYVGGFVGYTTQSVSNSTTTANVVGSGNQIGGFAGRINGNATTLTASGNVSGGMSNCGGLIGYFNGGARSITGSQASGSVSCQFDNVGGLLGRINATGSTVTNSHSTGTGTITARAYAGGLIGNTPRGTITTITNTSASKAVNVTNGYAGGLIGRAQAGADVFDSFATGAVTSTGASNDFVGGLIGYVEDNGAHINQVIRCYATGDVTGGRDYVGGLIGDWVNNNAGSNVAGVFAAGNVSGRYYVGGLMGRNRTTLTNSYALGNAFGLQRVGGLVGRANGGSINTSYARGNINRTGGTNTSQFGLIVGWGGGAYVGNYYNSDAVFLDQVAAPQVPNGLGGTPLLTAQMDAQNVANFPAFTFAAGAGDWKMPGAGYVPPWNPLVTYSGPIFNFQP